METRELWQRLAAFGLDENEARLYFHLSQAGAQRASELSDSTGIHRTEVYRVAKGLVDKGFAERTLERPVRFAPRPLSDVLAMHTRRVQREVESLEEQGRRLLADWPRRAQEWEEASTRFVVHQGMPQVRALVERMIEQATDEVVVVATCATIRRMGLALALGNRQDDVRVRILTHVEPEFEALVADLGRVAVVRHMESPPDAELIVQDEQEVAMVVADSHGKQEETVLWLNARAFVTGQRAVADSLWAQALDPEDVLRAGRDGRRPRHAQVVRGGWAFLARLKVLMQASDSIVVHCSAAEWDAWQRRGLAQLVEGRRRQGADIRFMVAGVDAAHLPEGVVAAAHDLPLSVAATPHGDVLAVRPSHDVWGLQAALPEVGLWVWHLLQAQWDEACLRRGQEAPAEALGPDA